MHTMRAVHYGRVMRFPDSTFAASRLGTDSKDEFAWGRLFLLAIVLTIAAASAGLLAGG
jgi:hypothetical protein